MARGGSRAGSGRKCIGSEPKVQTTITITQAEMSDLKSLKKRGIDTNKVIGKEIRRLATAYDLSDLGLG